MLITSDILPILSMTELATLLFLAALSVDTPSKEIAILEVHALMIQSQTLGGDKQLALTRSAVLSTTLFRNTTPFLHANEMKTALIATSGSSSKAMALRQQLALLPLLQHRPRALGQKHARRLDGGDAWMRPAVSRYP